jgi:hypothetical protein
MNSNTNQENHYSSTKCDAISLDLLLNLSDSDLLKQTDILQTDSEKIRTFGINEIKFENISKVSMNEKIKNVSLSSSTSNYDSIDCAFLVNSYL